MPRHSQGLCLSYPVKPTVSNLIGAELLQICSAVAAFDLIQRYDREFNQVENTFRPLLSNNGPPSRLAVHPRFFFALGGGAAGCSTMK
jgi:hypothetical protein